MREPSRKALYYSIVAYALITCCFVTLLIATLSIYMQMQIRNHPEKLLTNHSSYARFFRSLSAVQQKRLFALGITSGILAGVCLGASEKKPKNLK